MTWLGDHPWLLVPLAVLVAYLVIRLGFAVLHMLGTEMERPTSDPPLTKDVEGDDVRYRCIVCATEVRMTKIADDDFEPPRHCREDMQLVVEAGNS